MTLVAALVYVVVVTILYGIMLNHLATSRILERMAMSLMRFTRAQKFTVQVILAWIAYLGCGIIFMVIGMLCFPGGRGQFGWSLTWTTVLVATLGFLAQSSTSSLGLMGVKAIKPSLRWDQIVWDIGWVSVSEKLPTGLRVIYPMSSSLVEEILFRCVMYPIVRAALGGVPGGTWIAIGIIAVAFCAQQVLNTQTFWQGVAMATGSFAVSVIGCLMMEVSGSYLPTIATHMAFALFYTQAFRTGRHQRVM
ncbi:MAG: CPBP family intramembrane metalloprotease [Propionibacteriaceae bacterium]|nr:CPBP family intramembrane metalloprotease [Propionibacteriaceae bacterium]